MSPRHVCQVQEVQGGPVSSRTTAQGPKAHGTPINLLVPGLLLSLWLVPPRDGPFTCFPREQGPGVFTAIFPAD